MTYRAAITGGARGIGAGLAEALVARGYRVVALDREAPRHALAGVEYRRVDLGDRAATEAAADALVAEGDVTHIVHNAGAIRPALLPQARGEDIAALAQVHLGAALTLTQAVLPGMRARRFGRVLFTGSRAALGVPTRSAYAATKAGILGLARTWALELAGDGITVNVVSPGPIRTQNFWDIVPEGSEAEAALAARIPVGRLGEVADVVNAFLFFCNPESGFVTGQTLQVCGGASVGALSL